MKVILYMAITANGFIARENNETSWSEKEWESYANQIKNSDAIIIGRKTYDLMRANKEFDKISNPFTVVITNSKIKDERNFVFVKSAKESLNLLKKKGFFKVVVCGGSEINSIFMKENLIDEIYLDIEPFIFGKGIKLFSDSEFEKKLELVEVNRLSNNEIQLHYKIK